MYQYGGWWQTQHSRPVKTPGPRPPGRNAPLRFYVIVLEHALIHYLTDLGIVTFYLARFISQSLSSEFRTGETIEYFKI